MYGNTRNVTTQIKSSLLNTPEQKTFIPLFFFLIVLLTFLPSVCFLRTLHDIK